MTGAPLAPTQLLATLSDAVGEVVRMLGQRVRLAPLLGELLGFDLASFQGRGFSRGDVLADGLLDRTRVRAVPEGELALAGRPVAGHVAEDLGDRAGELGLAGFQLGEGFPEHCV